MAMTKAEQARMDALEEARDMARALRWPEGNEPPPVHPDNIKKLAFETVEGLADRKVMVGWTYNLARALACDASALTQVWCDGQSFGEVEWAGRVTPSQYRGQTIYLTREAAHVALRHAVTREVAKTLLWVDRFKDAT